MSGSDVEKQDDELFDELISDYTHRKDSGEVIDRETIISQNPGVADRLRNYFDSMDMLGQFQFENLDAPDPLDSNSADSTFDDASPANATLIEHQFKDDIRGSIYDPGVPVDPVVAATEKATEAARQAAVPETTATDEDDSFVGTDFGRYQIGKLLGCGMMGSVYVAHDKNLDRDVALKIPKESELGKPGFIDRFYREARSAATLDHPNICQVHDVGEINNTHYISMTYVIGKRLSELIDPNAPASERKVAALVRKISAAMYDAHRKGVVHRDLKPDNIMVDRRHEPIIMDFGLARQTNSIEDGRITRTGQLVGTPAFMSPEQVDGETELIGPPTDIYSLGVILFELLTGQLPFQGKLTVVLRKIAGEPPPKPTSIRPGLNKRLEAICLKMLEKDIADRYSSMSEVALDLGALLKGKKDPSRSSSKKVKPSQSATPAQKPSKDRQPSTKSAPSAETSEKIPPELESPSLDDLEEIQLMTMDGLKNQVETLIQDGDIQGAMRLLDSTTKLSGSEFAEYVEWASSKLTPLIEQMSETPESAKDLIRDAMRMIQKRDFHEAHELLKRVPKEKRNSKVLGLLKDVRGKVLEIETLSHELAEAHRSGQFDEETLMPKIARILELNPQHFLAKKTLREISSAKEDGVFGRWMKKFGKR